MDEVNVRDICDRLLATPPPLRDSRAVLATARHALARRRRAGLASAGILAITAITGAVLTVPASGPGEQAPSAAAPVSATTVPAPETAPGDLPPARAAFNHSAAMRQLLLAAVPAGYTTADFPVSRDKDFDPAAVLPNEEYPAPVNGVMSVAFAGVFLRADGGEGLLSASILTTAGRNVREPCGMNAMPSGGTCEVVDVDGVSVEVTSWVDEAGQHIGVVRWLRGGWLLLLASQGMATGETRAPLDGVQNKHPTIKPPLAELPFTKGQVAALAADPAMLQFP
jgi:hypothetical protein